MGGWTTATLCHLVLVQAMLRIYIDVAVLSKAALLILVDFLSQWDRYMCQWIIVKSLNYDKFPISNKQRDLYR